MKPESLKLFAKLMEKGYITREQEPAYYEYYNDTEIASELAVMEQERFFFYMSFMAEKEIRFKQDIISKSRIFSVNLHNIASRCDQKEKC